MAKRNKGKLISLGIVSAILVIAFVITESFFGNIFNLAGLKGEKTVAGKMTVDFIDVGQGDCTLITTTDSVILVDGGESGYSQTVINYIKNKGISEIDLCIATHPHTDHIGSLVDVFNDFEVKGVMLLEAVDHNTATYERLLEYTEENDVLIPAQVGETYSYGELDIELLGPVAEYDDINSMSIVAKVTFGGTSVMLTGDASTQSEEDMLSDNSADYSADILKIGHHGSNTSTCEEWLSAVEPQYAVISCGEGNSYGHPHKELIQRLDKFDIDYYRTDLLGDIVFESDGEKFTLVS